LRTDEKHIRAQSAISYKSHPEPPLFLSLAGPLAATIMTKTFARMWQLLRSKHNRIFGTDALFIRTKNRVGARERAMIALGMRRNLRRRK